MCTHMMSGQLYSVDFGAPLGLLGVLLGLALLVACIVFLTYWSRRSMAYRKQYEPQPHDAPYIYTEPREPALEILRERYTRGEIDP